MSVKNTRNGYPTWAILLISLVTILAGSILILSAVLGVRAGQQQVEIQRAHLVGAAVQQAVDLRAAGKLSEALAAYKTALVLDPGNPAAIEGVEQLMRVGNLQVVDPAQSASAISGTMPLNNAAEIVTNPAPSVAMKQSGATPASLSAASTADVNTLWQDAQTALNAGRSQNAIDALLQIKQSNPNFQTSNVDTALFTAYVNLATQQDGEDNLEAALDAYEQASLLRPTDTAIRSETQLLEDYLQMRTSTGANWKEAIRLMKAILALDYNYRDVSKRLQEAYVDYGDALLVNAPCDAIAQYDAAEQLIGTTNLLTNKRSQAQVACATMETAIALSGTLTTSVNALGTPVSPAAGDLTTQPSVNLTGLTGRLIYGVRDLNDGRMRILAQPAAGGAPSVLLEDATHPTLRRDGQRLAFSNQRGDMNGISAADVGGANLFAITRFTEDRFPSWNASGNRVAFASTREGDRQWRLYLAWAQPDGEAVMMGPGEAPSWHPSADQLAFRGCDTTGNGCGLWLMDGAGNNRAPLTNAPNDTRPSWSPDGRSVVFMSDGRVGNLEIYRVDVSTRQVLPLTDNPYSDALPTVSPDGQWVAFVSNRDGYWKLWVVSINGGEARLLAAFRGDFGDWSNQQIQWVN